MVEVVVEFIIHLATADRNLMDSTSEVRESNDQRQRLELDQQCLYGSAL